MSAQREAPVADDRSPVQLLVLGVGAQLLALDLHRVEELLMALPITPLGREPSGVDGVFKLRGQVLPAIDLRRRLVGEVPSSLTGRERLVICRVGRRRLALLVDRVLRVLRVPLDELLPAPSLPGGEPPAHVAGVCGSPQGLILLLDVKALLRAGGAG